MKYLWLFLFPSLALADCNSGGLPCAIDSNCPISGTTYLGTWYTPCGVGFCEPSSCHWHQPTYACPDTQVWTGHCIAGTSCGFTFTVSPIGCSACGAVADCVNTVAFCTLGACPSWTPWTNDGCGPIDGCAIGQMGQSASGSGAACCGPTIKHQCVASALCSPPTILTFVASPTTVELGSQVTLSWTLGGGAPTSLSIDNGVGPVVGLSVNATPGAVGSITYTLSASNALGTVTKSVSLTVIPPLPRCGAGKICGQVMAWEKPSLLLPQIPVDLYDSSGKVKRMLQTDSAGTYNFTGLPAGTYYVRAMPDRTEQDIENAIVASPNNVIGKVDFHMRYVPADVTVTGPADTFVAFTASPIVAWSDAIPHESAVIDLNGMRHVKLRGAHDYYMTCWILNTHVWPYIYEQGPSVHINGGAPLWPQDHITEGCP